MNRDFAIFCNSEILNGIVPMVLVQKLPIFKQRMILALIFEFYPKIQWICDSGIFSFGCKTFLETGP